jgi:hypothetical protein
MLLIEKLHISKNELKYQGRSLFNDHFYELTKWIHVQSEIRFTRKDYLEGSGKKGEYEYDYMLPGISPMEFHQINKQVLPYQQINFTNDEVIHYFKLLEKKNLINKIPMY